MMHIWHVWRTFLVGAKTNTYLKIYKISWRFPLAPLKTWFLEYPTCARPSIIRILFLLERWFESRTSTAMKQEIRLLVTDELVELEKWPVHVQDFNQIADRSKIIYRVHFKSKKWNSKIWTCNRSRLIMPKVFPDTDLLSWVISYLTFQCTPTSLKT